MQTNTKNNNIIYSTCPSCGSSEISNVLSAKDYTVSSEQFEVWHCATCELRFTQEIPVEEEVGAYYQSEEYISHSNTSKGLVNRLYQTVRNITLKQKRDWVQKVSGKQDGRILDIGCGTGEFLSTMKSAGWKTLGLEPDDGARSQAQSNHGLEVKEQDHLFQISDANFDIVSMWHVLEHVHRLHPYLDQIHKVLDPNGKLIIAVPNYQSKDADIYQEHWAAYDVPRHLYHFSPKSMEMLLNSHGFELVQKKLMPFDGFYVSMLSEKYKYGKSRLVQAFFSGLKSWMEGRKNVDRSSSVIYLAKKKA